MSGLVGKRAILVTAVVGAATASAALLTSWSSSPAHAAAPPQSSLVSGFMDHTSNDYLRVQLDSSAAGYGQFAVALPGVGLSWSAQPASVTVEFGNSDQLRYDGPGFLGPNAILDTEFGVAYQQQGPTTSEPIRLIGQVDPAHGTGSIEVWVAGTHYHFASLAVPHDAGSTAAAVLTAIKAEDWPTLYSLADTSLRDAMTAQQFAQQVNDGFGGGQVNDAQQTGQISYTTNSAGTIYANVPATFAVTHDGQTQTVSATVVLIRDGGSWRWFTTKSAQ
jgi:hypothetical protein